MVTKNLCVKYDNVSFLEDINRLSGQNAGLGEGTAFKDVMSNLLGSEEASGRNHGAPRLNAGVRYTGYADLKASLSGISKSDACDEALMQKKIESAIKWLAWYLGVKPSFLLAVFEELGIDPNDMADEMKFIEIINKLAEHFNLSEEEKKEIIEEMGGILGFSF